MSGFSDMGSIFDSGSTDDEPQLPLARILGFMTGFRPILGILAVTAALTAAAVPARADQDAVQFFNNIDITADTPVKDAVCFFCSVRVEGKVNGDIVVLFGSASLDGVAQHDVVTVFGNVTAADNSRISGDLVSIFGNARLGENVTVGQDVVSVFGNVQAPFSVKVHGDRVGIPAIVFWGPLLLIVGVVWLIVHELRVRRRQRAMAAYPYPPPR
jgi:hypothetical protein